jgi:hypothetical protein
VESAANGEFLIQPVSALLVGVGGAVRPPALGDLVFHSRGAARELSAAPPLVGYEGGTMTMALYKRARFLTIPLSLLLGWTAPAQGPAQSQGKGTFSFSPIVLPGQPSPDGGAFFSCSDCDAFVVGSRAFNTRQEVGFNAETDAPPCLFGDFLVSATKTVWLAGQCSRAPSGNAGLLSHVNLNERGDAAVLTGPIDSENFIDPTILLYSGGQISVAAKNGDPTTGGRTEIGPLSKKHIFSEPFVNNNDEVSFWGSTVDAGGMEHFGIFSASGGKSRVVASDGDRAPVLGTFNFFIFPSFSAINNDSGEILFEGKIFPDQPGPELFGLFLSTPDGIRKIVASGDALAGGYTVLPGSSPAGMLNNNDHVAFCTILDNPSVSDSGIFLYSSGAFQKVVAQGDPSPIGGKFATFLDPSLDEMVDGGIHRPQLNSRDQVVFKAKAGTKGKTPALFMASPTAILKIVAVGDVLPNGETIGEINTYSLNEIGQVAFVAYRRPGEIGPLGLWVASPVGPSIRTARLKLRNGSPALIVNGSGFITNDSVIEINGAALGNTDYPTDFQENGGTTTRIVSSDPAILDLVSPGSTVRVTVRNQLTGGLVSGAFALTR